MARPRSHPEGIQRRGPRTRPDSSNRVQGQAGAHVGGPFHRQVEVEYFIDISPFTELLKKKLLFEIRNYFSIRENRRYLEFRNLKQRMLYYLKNAFLFEDEGGLVSDVRRLELRRFMSEMSLDNWKNFLEYFQISDEIVEIVE